ncbi:hypothetical protein L484_004965 [Morus notabilis]|uniref:Uncharacterized protein n=1 Tax=Morus notabilis TaxID=981085 RepID=W9QS88_9ROSA|nr:hypothetical protein L484_004965 [Morus notabilis]
MRPWGCSIRPHWQHRESAQSRQATTERPHCRRWIPQGSRRFASARSASTAAEANPTSLSMTFFPLKIRSKLQRSQIHLFSLNTKQKRKKWFKKLKKARFPNKG